VKNNLKPRLHVTKITLALLFVVFVFLLSVAVAPTVSISANLCGQCHQGYDQRLDILEGNNQNIIPTDLQVGQSTMVSLVIQNICNAPRYTDLVSVSVTLTSQSGHFIVTNPTYNIPTLSVGTSIATWQITGAIAGQDHLFISAKGVNTHHRTIFLSDNYSPSPIITVTGLGTFTPTPTPISIDSPTPTVTLAPTPNPSQTPLTPAASQTPTTGNTPTATPQTLSPTPVPTGGNSTPYNATPGATATQTPAPSDGNELDSNMLYIHPPISIASYAFIFLLTAVVFKQGAKPNKHTRTLALVTWFLTTAGLFTGMLWAQIAWGSYWSWDAKETLTLMLFLTLSATLVTYLEKKTKLTKYLLVTSCVLVVLVALTSFAMIGPHSFL
jgi:hypothetical protein